MEDQTATLKTASERLLQRTSSRPQYEKIELTPQETEEALRKGRENKAFKIQEEEHWKRVNEPDLPPNMSANDFLNHIIRKSKEKFNKENFQRDFLNHEGRAMVYAQLAKYFTNSDSCEYSLHKGILLQGNVGCGKSFFMKLCSNNPRKSFHVFDCVKLPGEYASVDDRNNPWGERLINKFRNALGPKAFDAWKHQYCGAMFDDLGWEEVLKHYGNEVNVMERIINGIYSASLPFWNYHATTNLTVDELELKYGSRIISRLHEMFNFVVLPGSDLRKYYSTEPAEENIV